MTNKNNCIKIFRPKPEDPFFFKETFTKWQAWCDLIMLALCEDREEVIRGIVVEEKRGSIYVPKTTLAERWKWDKKKVLRFLKLLEKLDMVTLQKSNVIGCISIINYDSYQCSDTANDTAKNTDDTANDTPNDTANATTEIVDTQLVKQTKSKKNTSNDTANATANATAFDVISIFNKLNNNYKYNIYNIKKENKKKENLVIPFEEIWAFYGKKGTKKTAKSRFENLSKEAQLDAVLYLPYYLAFTVPQYRKGFEVYISREQWKNVLHDPNGNEIPFIDKETGETLYHVANMEDFKAWFNNLIKGTPIPQIDTITPDRMVNINICYTNYPKQMSRAMKIILNDGHYAEMIQKGMITFDYIFNPTNILKICERGGNE